MNQHNNNKIDNIFKWSKMTKIIEKKWNRGKRLTNGNEHKYCYFITNIRRKFASEEYKWSLISSKFIIVFGMKRNVISDVLVWKHMGHISKDKFRRPIESLILIEFSFIFGLNKKKIRKIASPCLPNKTSLMGMNSFIFWRKFNPNCQ